MVVEAWLLRAASAHPRRTAIETPEARLTYSELHDAARGAAATLAEQGIGAGDWVALGLPPGVQFAVALHACMLLGAVSVPVDPRLTPEERELVTARARLVVSQPLEATGSPGAARPATHDLAAAAIVVHTSGTSARPRPIELTYGNWLWSALGAALALGLDPEERWLCALPLAHVGGLSILVRSVIYGTTAVIHERFEAERVLAELGDPAGSTLVSLVATTLARLLEAGLERPPRLRCALVGGMALPSELSRRARAAGVPVRHTYGLTEACSQVTVQPVGGDEAPGDPQTTHDAGAPLFCTQVKIAEDGEILVRGPTVAPGSVAGDGWLHTGDRGQLQDGRLRVSGRKSNAIVTGGENVAPEEVEAVLAAHPAVAEALVTGSTHPEWGEAVVASVVLRPGRRASASELRQHCGQHLAPFKVPKEIRFTTEPLPRNRTGKLVRSG
jgi:O-succinylbenzoic acid--CoA ligase